MRSAVTRLLAAAFALSWLVLPGFGLIDFAFAWAADWPQVLEAGWGVYFTFLVGAPFVLVAVRPDRLPVAVVQLAIAALVLGVSVVVADEPQLAWVPVVIAIETATLAWLGRLRLADGVSFAPSLPLLAVGLVGAVPWLLYAGAMYAANREGRIDSDITNDIDHYSVQGAVGVALVALVSVAALWPGGRRFIGTCVGLSGAYLGVVSFAWPSSPGGFEAVWSLAAIAWGVAVVSLAWLDRRAAASR
jgi:hypothetical protein